MPAITGINKIYDIQERLVKQGIIPHPSEQKSSILVIFAMDNIESVRNV